MPIFANARIARGMATAVVLLSLASAYDAVRATAVAEPVIVNSAAEARRWMDDRMGRTTLPARFNRSGSCFNLSGLLALRGDRVELLFRQSSAGEFGYRSSDDPSAIVLADDHCLIQLHISQEVLDGGQWMAVPLRKRPEIKLPTSAEGKALEQQLPPLGEWRIIPNKPGGGAQLTLERKGFGAWDGVSMREVVFSENSQQSCPRGTALFAVTPTGARKRAYGSSGLLANGRRSSHRKNS
jgi:hypothetical protein